MRSPSANGRVLIVQRGRGGLWEQFWEFPTVHLEGVDPAGRSFGEPVDLAEGVKRLTGIAIEPGPAVEDAHLQRHQPSCEAECLSGKAVAGTPKPGPGLVDARWVEPASLVEYTFSSASRRLIAWINEEPNRLVADRRDEVSK